MVSLPKEYSGAAVKAVATPIKTIGSISSAIQSVAASSNTILDVVNKIMSI
ncbi:hypothetical protein [Clostridium sp. CF012]|uniref:hypothetical protein n=1 Tax=Clostridium sp. CF012 TaxID=2843319 RepID=UPI001C0BACAA|nr:hypothetical protein [Clostridium sp. CF012]MBU3145795.1 hypothetical protein [Clostridium sp. CF012]